MRWKQPSQTASLSCVGLDIGFVSGFGGWGGLNLNLIVLMGGSAYELPWDFDLGFGVVRDRTTERRTYLLLPPYAEPPPAPVELAVELVHVPQPVQPRRSVVLQNADAVVRVQHALLPVLEGVDHLPGRALVQACGGLRRLVVALDDDRVLVLDHQPLVEVIPVEGGRPVHLHRLQRFPPRQRLLQVGVDHGRRPRPLQQVGLRPVGLVVGARVAGRTRAHVVIEVVLGLRIRVERGAERDGRVQPEPDLAVAAGVLRVQLRAVGAVLVHAACSWGQELAAAAGAAAAAPEVAWRPAAAVVHRGRC